MTYRPEQSAENLTHLAAKYLSREAGRETLLTVTRTSLSQNGRQATIFISVFPEDQGEHALRFLERHEKPFREFLKKEGRFSILPFVSFVLDAGEANRQRLDELSNELHRED